MKPFLCILLSAAIHAAVFAVIPAMPDLRTLDVEVLLEREGAPVAVVRQEEEPEEEPTAEFAPQPEEPNVPEEEELPDPKPEPEPTEPPEAPDSLPTHEDTRASQPPEKRPPVKPSNPQESTGPEKEGNVEPSYADALPMVVESARSAGRAFGGAWRSAAGSLAQRAAGAWSQGRGEDAAASGNGDGGRDLEAALAAYKQEVSRVLQQAQFYPRLARRARQEGRAVVEVVIDSRGTILDVSLVKSSGYAALDKAALKSARGVGKLPLPPPELGWDRRALRVPYRFTLTR